MTELMEITMLNKRKRRPSHPGAILEDILPDANLSQTELARLIGVSRRTVNEIINERRPVTVDMAHRLSIIFKTNASELVISTLCFVMSAMSA